jgi:hypothetical protein
VGTVWANRLPRSRLWFYWIVIKPGRANNPRVQHHLLFGKFPLMSVICWVASPPLHDSRKAAGRGLAWGCHGPSDRRQRMGIEGCHTTADSLRLTIEARRATAAKLVESGLSHRTAMPLGIIDVGATRRDRRYKHDMPKENRLTVQLTASALVFVREPTTGGQSPIAWAAR